MTKLLRALVTNPRRLLPTILVLSLDDSRVHSRLRTTHHTLVAS